MSPTDYANTKHAQENRRRKAEALAVEASHHGLQPYELRLVGGTVADATRRETVRKAAGLKTRPSDETWTLALAALEAGARTRPGAMACGVCGWFVLPVKTESGATVLVDPFAHPDGRVWPQTRAGKTVAVIIAGHQSPPEDTPLFRMHATSCPETRQAAERRRREAPRCTSCGNPLDGVLAHTSPSYTIHPNCAEEVTPRAHNTTRPTALRRRKTP